MKVVLLDRDGTVIRDPEDERVDSVDKIELFPNSIDALKYLSEHGYSAIFITNQAGIAEGRITESEFWEINSEVIRELSPSGIEILRTYVCPHSPDDHCECRKPSPKMIVDAIRDFNLSKDNLFFIGDRESDILAGVAAGVQTVLVKTANVPVISKSATHTADNLLDAAHSVVQE